jgi:hypothetical protein
MGISGSDVFLLKQVRFRIWIFRRKNSGIVWLMNPRELSTRSSATCPSLAERTILGAYKQHVGNPDAVKPSDTWSRWSSDFAWRERAAAYDDHLSSLRRDAYERATEEEAEKQAREVEKTRYRYNELMTVAYHRAMECLEDEDWVSRNLRSQDVIRIIGLHLDALKTFGVEEPRAEDDWTEEDEADIDRIIREVEEGDYPEEEDLL